MFLGAELPGARVCHRQSPGTEAELTTGGEGGEESKFPSAAGCWGWVGGGRGSGRRGREEAEAADDHDPAAAGKLLGSRRRRRRRHRLDPHPNRAPPPPPRLVGSERCLRGTGTERTGRKAARAQARHGEPSVAGTGPEGRSGARERARGAEQNPELKRREGQKRKCGGPGVRGGGWGRGLAVRPVPKPTRDPATTAGAGAVSKRAWGACLAEGARACVLSFPGSQGLARERPHRRVLTQTRVAAGTLLGTGAQGAGV